MNTTHTNPDNCENGNVLDVRPLSGRIKHATIFQWWSTLPVGGTFVLVNDHDPVPLRYQFEAEFSGAFSWEYLEQGPDVFRVKLSKLRQVTAAVPSPPPRATGVTTVGAAGVQELDARGMEPPEPLVQILAALERLPDGMKLRAHTDREPCHLFGEATSRGFSHECIYQADGSWVTTLTRN